MKRILSLLVVTIVAFVCLNAKTMVVYYSYTNNVERIIDNLRSQIACDVVRIEPAEKGLDYAANNYALGSALISAIRNNPDSPSSYPEIDAVDINFDDYDVIIIGAPLWWSQMAAPLQTFLFNNGKKMAGKKIGVIVSSHTSGISGVVSDAKRLIPDGDFLEPALWVKSSEVGESNSMISKWLEDVDYQAISAGMESVTADMSGTVVIYNLNGVMISKKDMSGLVELNKGTYIIKQNGNARKIIIR